MRGTGSMARAAGLALALAVITAACSNAGNITNMAGQKLVGIRFGATSSLTASRVPGTMLAAGTTPATSLTINGTNGTLDITGVYLVVSRIQLEQADSACAKTGEEAECEGVRLPPTFVSVPLDGTSALVVTEPVPAGQYVELHFKVQNLQEDAEDTAANPQIDSLLAQVRKQFANWPAQASMLITGSFTPTGGTATSFSDYFRAEIEVNRHLQPPLTVSGTSTSTDLTVQLSPSGWFMNPDSSVTDLSKMDYATTNQVVEFDGEMDHGFGGISEHPHHGGD